MATSAVKLIEAISRTRARLQSDPARLSRLARLQQWQVRRLRRTYNDCAADARYHDALEFFFHDLYGPHEFGQRDRDLKKVLTAWEHALPRRAAQAVIDALELEALTQTLDLAVLDALGEAAPTQTSYAAAYRQAGRRNERQRQIWLILSSGRELDELVRHPMIRTALRMARIPARIAGVTVLHEFLERGSAAFAKMDSAQDLLRKIEQRETRIMQRLFAGAPDPFNLARHDDSREAHRS